MSTSVKPLPKTRSSQDRCPLVPGRGNPSDLLVCCGNGSFVSLICCYSLPFWGLSFYLAYPFLCCAKAFKFNQVPLVYFCFYFPWIEEVGQTGSCFDLCHQGFCLCFPLRVQFLVLHLGLPFFLLRQELLVCVPFRLQILFGTGWGTGNVNEDALPSPVPSKCPHVATVSTAPVRRLKQ